METQMNKIEFTALASDDAYIGNRDSRVILIELCSMMSQTSKRFHDNCFSTIKRQYVDQGTVLYIVRDFPTDLLSLRIALILARINEYANNFKARAALMAAQDTIIKRVVAYKNSPKRAMDEAMSVVMDVLALVGYDIADMELYANPNSEMNKAAKDALIDRANHAVRLGYSECSLLINGSAYGLTYPFEKYEEIIASSLQQLTSLLEAEQSDVKWIDT
jgi:hypothetical protein